MTPFLFSRLGDALLLGFGDDLRKLLGIGGVNLCSTEYKFGALTSFAFGGVRLAYAGIAKLGAAAKSSGVAAHAFRNNLKSIFRGGTFPNWRNFSYTEALAKYGTDAMVKYKAGVTNIWLNLYGAGVAISGANGALN